MPQTHRKYVGYPVIDFPERTWPSRRLSAAPLWCSVDLRDGNQALAEPMGKQDKLTLFEQLVQMGYRQIEVGFPAASQTDFDFVRLLIEEQRIPADVTIQVLVQARKALIERTFEAVAGARRVIVHLYNSTSTIQRRVVFGMSVDQVRDLAVEGTRWVKEQSRLMPDTEVTFQYSPESFTGTELPVALSVCDAVIDEWDPSDSDKMILNLPATVEMSTPNVYADQIEWMCRHLRRRKEVIISVHAHNDRGCAIAATELAMLAGAERVEGTLFGNGERTGNVDLVTLAMNLYSQGIDPQIDISNLPSVVAAFESSCGLAVHPRQPYAGELVFTAFSGSHQDAIRKGLAQMAATPGANWQVPYLPIDPADIGRHYEPLVRINSQSGKGGIAFVLERTGGYRVPKGMAVEFSRIIQKLTDDSGKELSPERVKSAFEDEYLTAAATEVLSGCKIRRESDELCQVDATVQHGCVLRRVTATGKGPIDAFVKGINRILGSELHCIDYAEHAMSAGEEATAIAYVGLTLGSHCRYGAGKADDIAMASLHAVWRAVSRLLGSDAAALIADTAFLNPGE